MYLCLGDLGWRSNATGEREAQRFVDLEAYSGPPGSHGSLIGAGRLGSGRLVISFDC